VSGQQHAPALLYLRERPGTHCTEGWVGPRAGLDGRKITPPLGFDSRTVQPVVSHYVEYIYLTKLCCIFRITDFIRYGNSGRESPAHVWGPWLWASNYSREVTTDVWAGTLSCSDSSKTGRGCRSNLQIHCNYHIIRIGGAVYCPSTEAVYVNGEHRIIPCCAVYELLRNVWSHVAVRFCQLIFTV